MAIAQHGPSRFASPPPSAYARGASLANDGSHMASTSLAESFATNRGALLRYLRARGAGDDAEDLLQELWLKTDLPDQSDIIDPRAFLYRMAHNVMLDRLRADVRRRKREQDYHDQQIGSANASDVMTAEHILSTREDLRHVERALAALGDRTDFIFRRYRVEGVSQKDIAHELGITLSAVEKHLQKAYRAVAIAQRAVTDCEMGPSILGIKTDD
jgi:RNA polymerase sigma-70 factor (ECF subfamily)